jgi:hypothetical protein
MQNFSSAKPISNADSLFYVAPAFRQALALALPCHANLKVGATIGNQSQ